MTRRDMDWVEWHRRYDTEPAMAARLRCVQDWIGRSLGDAAPGPIRVLSLCAGDGRDLLDVLEDHRRAGDVRALLVESDAHLAAVAKDRALRLGRAEVRVVESDAGRPDTFADIVPVELLLACGVFGNIPDSEVERTIRAFAGCVQPGATAIWTRHRGDPDLTPTIRSWFADAGWRELAFVPIPDSTASVGVARYEGEVVPFTADGRLFSFVA